MSYSAFGYWGSDEGYYDWPDLRNSSIYKKFGQNNWESDEVYVFRLEVSGLPSEITSTSQAYPLVRAFIEAQDSDNLNQDVRGICFRSYGGGRYVVEIIITHAGGFHSGTRTTKDIMSNMRSSLSEQGYSGRIDKGNFYYIEDDQSVLQKWFAQPAIWSWLAYKNAGMGSRSKGFTQAYMEGKGVWLNSSATSQQYMLKPPPPVYIAPPPPPAPPKEVKPNVIELDEVVITAGPPGPSLMSVVLAASALGIGWLLLSPKLKRGRK